MEPRVHRRLADLALHAERSLRLLEQCIKAPAGSQEGRWEELRRDMDADCRSLAESLDGALKRAEILSLAYALQDLSADARSAATQPLRWGLEPGPALARLAGAALVAGRDLRVALADLPGDPARAEEGAARAKAAALRLERLGLAARARVLSGAGTPERLKALELLRRFSDIAAGAARAAEGIEALLQEGSPAR